MKRSFILALLCISQAHAQHIQQVGISIEFISVESQVAFDLAAKDHETPARTALVPLLENGTAKIEELAFAFTYVGTQAQVDSVVEVIYPTEYDPSETFKTLVGPIDGGDQLRTPANPTAFQTRNLGLSVKVTPSSTDDPQVIALDLRVDQSIHAGNDSQGQFESQLTWPRFHSTTVYGSKVVKNGEDTLVGLLSTHEANSSRRLLAFLRSTYLPLNTAPVDNPEQHASNVEILVEAISLPEDAIPGLLREHVITDATPLRETIASLIKAGSAEISETAFAINRNGVKGQVRSGNERIYSVEFDPPRLPQSVTGPIPPDARLATPAHSTTAEMRPEGFSFEGNGNWNTDNDTIDLTLRPGKTTHLGVTYYGQGVSMVKLPIFASQGLTSNITIPNGGYALLGLHSERAQDGANLHKYTLVFARAIARKP